MQIVEGDVNDPRPGQVRVRIQAGVSFADVLMREGISSNGSAKALYARLGYRGLGREMGVGITSEKVGDAVAAMPIASTDPEK